MSKDNFIEALIADPITADVLWDLCWRRIGSKEECRTEHGGLAWIFDYSMYVTDLNLLIPKGQKFQINITSIENNQIVIHNYIQITFHE